MSGKVTFDIDRMGSAAHELYSLRTRAEALSRRVAQIDVAAVKDPGLKSLLEQRGRRLQLMASGDAQELAAVEHGVRGAIQRARVADGLSKRPSRAKSKHKPKPGGKVRPGGGKGKHVAFPGNHAGEQRMACWLASKAAGMGAPPELLVSAALVENGLVNGVGGDGSSTGLFQIQVKIHKVPPGFGSASGTFKDEQWWTDHPEAQVRWFADAVKQTAGHGRGPGTSGAQAVGGWAADIERPAEKYRGRYAQRYDEAHRLVGNCHAGAAPGGSHAPVAGGSHKPVAGGSRKPVAGTSKRAALGRRIDHNAERMVGIEKHQGTFAKMQSNAGSFGRQPWCAAFVFNAVLRSGKHLTGGGWATVATWVRAARAHQQGLSIVSAAEAKPGDLVAYDWDGGNDFSGNPSHIGVLDSGVTNGSFHTIEGNTTLKPGISDHKVRTLHSAANVVFIRVSP